MSYYDLTDEQHERELNDIQPRKHRPKRKDKRKYSEQELKELMGMDRDVYKRRNRRVMRR